MKAEEALRRLGGVASTAALLRLTRRRQLRAALRSGRIEQVGRGRYALPTASDARRAAGGLSAVVWLRSAAAHHGWALKDQPDLPELAVGRKRRIPAERRRDVALSWVSLGADDVHAGVTNPLRTLIDCARHLPFDEALTVADSALRAGSVSRTELDAVSVRGAGADAVRLVLRHADGRAANPFESVLRALLIQAGFEVEAQAAVALETGVVHPDVVCPAEAAVFEADSWTHHATRKAHRRDCARYNMLVLAGWRVFRFTWEQVMRDPAYVRWVLARVARRVEQAEVAAGLSRPA